MSKEIDQAGQRVMPFVGLGFVVMIICAIITCSLSAIYMKQFTFFKVNKKNFFFNY